MPGAWDDEFDFEDDEPAQKTTAQNKQAKRQSK